jgi:hypothetical protein
MKKRVLTLFLLIIGLLLISFVNAQPSNASSGFSGIGNSTSTTLTRTVDIPENLKILTRVIFGIKGDISLDVFMVVLCVLIGFILLLQNVMQFVPFFEGWKSWIGSVIVTLLIGVTGAFVETIKFLFHIANLFGILEKWPILRVTVLILLVIIFIFGINRLVAMMSKKDSLDKAEMEGRKAGLGMWEAKQNSSFGT